VGALRFSCLITRNLEVLELVAEGLHLVAYRGDEFLVEVKLPSPELQQRIAAVARRTAEHLVSDIPFPCTCLETMSW
jgi:hypothetical protein